MRRLVGVLILVMFTVSLPAVVAAKSHNRQDCASKSADRSIRGCTRIIKAGRDTRKILAIAYMNRGLAYSDKGQHDRAISDYNRALKLNPKYANAYNNRGNAYNLRGYKALRAGHAARALVDFIRAVEDAPKSANIRHSLGEGYFYSDDEEKARQVWRKTCDLASDKKARDWQKKLAKAGHYSGEIDGICGSGTIDAFASCARAKCVF